MCKQQLNLPNKPNSPKSINHSHIHNHNTVEHTSIQHTDLVEQVDLRRVVHRISRMLHQQCYQPHERIQGVEAFGPDQGGVQEGGTDRRFLLYKRQLIKQNVQGHRALAEPFSRHWQAGNFRGKRNVINVGLKMPWDLRFSSELWEHGCTRRDCGAPAPN